MSDARAAAPLLILGGAFDPIHNGHLHAAEFLNQWLRPASVRMIPSARPVHRAAAAADFEHRMAMLRRALEARDDIAVDDREAGRDGPSWSVDTVSELRAEIGARRSLCLCLGADALLDFHRWRRPREILRMANLIGLARPGYDIDAAPALEMGRREDDPEVLAATPAGAVALAPLPPLAVSSTEIRRRLSEGDVGVEAPPAVMAYIEAHSLYR